MGIKHTLFYAFLFYRCGPLCQGQLDDHRGCVPHGNGRDCSFLCVLALRPPSCWTVPEAQCLRPSQVLLPTRLQLWRLYLDHGDHDHFRLTLHCLLEFRRGCHRPSVDRGGISRYQVCNDTLLCCRVVFWFTRYADDIWLSTWKLPTAVGSLAYLRDHQAKWNSLAVLYILYLVFVCVC